MTALAAAPAAARATPTGATTGTPTRTATGTTGTTITTATTARTRTRSTAMTALAATPGIDVMKQVNRQFVTGVTVVTAMDGETPRGLAVNAFSSISLDPATVMVCVQRTSSTHDCLFRAGHLAINILSTGQLDVVGVFAGKSADKFRQVDWESGPFGSPLLTGSSARVEAEIRERLQASTHTIFICRVVHADVAEWPPMVYGAGKFFDGGALAPLG
ncbi:flavin reductase family protein [Streptomyces harbinensis]|uniref:flavin reductase family protein n=1 Tax=Streptomyces harbinensis TaxID=1176198 RepID=UPI0034E02A13